MPRLCASTSGITEAPVVVKPDMVSKKASVSVRGEADSRKGIMPNMEKKIHTDDISR